MSTSNPQVIAYTIPEAARLLRVTPLTIYNWHRTGKMTIRKFGARSIILASDLEAFVKNAPALVMAEPDATAHKVANEDIKRLRAGASWGAA
jgi:excisionase family DNA binding protein